MIKATKPTFSQLVSDHVALTSDHVLFSIDGECEEGLIDVHAYQINSAMIVCLNKRTIFLYAWLSQESAKCCLSKQKFLL